MIKLRRQYHLSLGPVKGARTKPIKLRICGKGTFVYEALHHALKPYLVLEGVSTRRLKTSTTTWLVSLKKLVEGTIRVEEITDLKKTFGEVADELRRQYSVSYYPKIPLTKGQRRQIRVSVRRPGLAVRARDSYMAVSH